MWNITFALMGWSRCVCFWYQSVKYDELSVFTWGLPSVLVLFCYNGPSTAEYVAEISTALLRQIQFVPSPGIRFFPSKRQISHWTLKSSHMNNKLKWEYLFPNICIATFEGKLSHMHSTRLHERNILGERTSEPAWDAPAPFKSQKPFKFWAFPRTHAITSQRLASNGEQWALQMQAGSGRIHQMFMLSKFFHLIRREGKILKTARKRYVPFCQATTSRIQKVPEIKVSQPHQ